MNQSSLGDQPARRGAGRALSLSVPQANISHGSSPFLTSFLIYCLHPGIVELAVNIVYMPYESLTLANQKSQKLGYLAGSWGEATVHVIVILINTRVIA